MSNAWIAQIKDGIDDAMKSVAVKAASLVIELHETDRQADLVPNTEFTKMKKKRPVNAGTVLADQGRFMKRWRAVRRGRFAFAVTNAHKLAGILIFGGPIKFFGKGIKYLPARDTVKMTIEAEEDALLEHVEEAVNRSLQIDKKIKVVIG